MLRANWIKSNVCKRAGETEWAHALAGGLSVRERKAVPQLQTGTAGAGERCLKALLDDSK